MSFIEELGLELPLIQAPMAGVATPAMAAAVSNAGALGSMGLGSSDPATARGMIEAAQQATGRPFNVNLFVHEPATADPERERAWIEGLRPRFAEFGAEPPSELREIYTSFRESPAMLQVLLETKPKVVSFHFGLPSPEVLGALKDYGAVLLVSATSLNEARKAESAGIDAVIAQGIEAGGHRGVFDPDAPDEGIGTLALTRLLVRESSLPVIAAGGIMDGAGIAAALKLGAVAAQLGTAFIDCPESSADEAHRQLLRGEAAEHTRLTRLISGRPARAIGNRFTDLEEQLGGLEPPSYPIAYDAGKALHAAASAAGDHGYGAHWAGQGAPLARSMPAAELVAQLAAELAAAG